MDGTQFKAIVQEFGEENLIGVVFDNSARQLFHENDFSLAKYWNESIQSLVFRETDSQRNPYLTVKHVENVQTLMFAIPGETRWDKLDYRQMSG